MGDKPQDDGSDRSLELPRLFGRKKQAGPAVEEPAAVPVEEPSAAPVEEPTAVLPPEPVPPPLFADEVPAPEAVVPAAPQAPQEASAEPLDETPDREFKMFALPGRIAAVVTGLLVGVFGALLTWGSLQGCEQLKGTDSCGGPGFFLLILVLILMILAGGMLLAAWEVPDPKATSALGVGIICVLVLLLLMEELLDPWMFVVVPVISALSFAAAHWVTTALVDESDLEPEPPAHDIR